MTLSGQRDPPQGPPLVVGDPGAHHLHGALLLWLDVPPGDPEPLDVGLQVRAEGAEGQAAPGFQPVQALPAHQVLRLSSLSRGQPFWEAYRPVCWILCLCWRGPLGRLSFRRSTPGALAMTSAARDTGIGPLAAVADLAYDGLDLPVLPFRQAHFHGVLLIGTLFAAILLLNRVFTRFWCRGICPLGAMLGMFSRFAIFGLQKDEEACGGCNKCLLNCQGGDNPIVGSKWRQSECHLCLNCQASCPDGALHFNFFPTATGHQRKPCGHAQGGRHPPEGGGIHGRRRGGRSAVPVGRRISLSSALPS